MSEPDPKDYQAVLTCRSCKSKRYVPKMATGDMRYWFCHYSDKGEGCWTLNVWEKNLSEAPA